MLYRRNHITTCCVYNIHFRECFQDHTKLERVEKSPVKIQNQKTPRQQHDWLSQRTGCALSSWHNKPGIEKQREPTTNPIKASWRHGTWWIAEALKVTVGHSSHTSVKRAGQEPTSTLPDLHTDRQTAGSSVGLAQSPREPPVHNISHLTHSVQLTILFRIGILTWGAHSLWLISKHLYVVILCFCTFKEHWKFKTISVINMLLGFTVVLWKERWGLEGEEFWDQFGPICRIYIYNI